jgi:LysM repeat protein
VTGRAFGLLKAAGALMVLICVIVGVPLLLAALRLVPHSVPSISEVIASLEVRDDGQLVQVVLATGVWVCWALFTLSTAAELIGLVRGRPAPMLPRLRIFQRPAAALVAAVAVGLTVAPAGAGAFASGTEDARPPLPVMTASSVASAAAREDVGVTVTRTASAYSAPEVPAPPTSTAKTYEVQRRDTLWALAERYLGDPLRYPEIVELNATAVGPDNEIYPARCWFCRPTLPACLPPRAARSPPPLP